MQSQTLISLCEYPDNDNGRMLALPRNGWMFHGSSVWNDCIPASLFCKPNFNHFTNQIARLCRVLESSSETNFLKPFDKYVLY